MIQPCSNKGIILTFNRDLLESTGLDFYAYMLLYIHRMATVKMHMSVLPAFGLLTLGFG